MTIFTSVYHHTVALAVDRVLAILAPFWHRNLNKSEIAKRISVAISISAVVLTVAETPFRKFDREINICVYNPSPPPLYFSIYILSVMLYIPIIILLFSNGIFVWALKRRRGKTVDKGKTRENQRRSNDTNYILMLLVTTCAFIVFQFVSFGLYNESARRNRMGLADGSASFFVAMGRLPIILNSSLNIVFYSSSPMFRKALKGSLARLCKTKTASAQQTTN